MARWKSILTAAGLVALAFVSWLAWNQDAISAWNEGVGPLPFFAAMAVLPAIGAPVTPLFVLAGATFGVGPGLVGSIVALGLNLTLCYVIARSALRSSLESLLRRFEYELPNFAQKETGALRFTLLVKMAPGAPAAVKNYLLGLTGVPFPLYLGVSLLITGGYAALCVVLGVSLFDHAVDHAIWVAAAVVVLALGVWLWRRRRNATAASGTSIARSEACASAMEDSHARLPGRERFGPDAPGSRRRRFEST